MSALSLAAMRHLAAWTHRTSDDLTQVATRPHTTRWRALRIRVGQHFHALAEISPLLSRDIAALMGREICLEILVRMRDAERAAAFDPATAWAAIAAWLVTCAAEFDARADAIAAREQGDGPPRLALSRSLGSATRFTGGGVAGRLGVYGLPTLPLFAG